MIAELSDKEQVVRKQLIEKLDRIPNGWKNYTGMSNEVFKDCIRYNWRKYADR